MPEALSWEPGPRQEVLYYDKAGVWHEALKKSDGLKRQPSKAVDLAQAPDKVKQYYDIVLPHYQQLYPHRLTA